MNNTLRVSLSMIADVIAVSQAIFNWVKEKQILQDDTVLLLVNILCIIIAVVLTIYLIYMYVAYAIRDKLVKCGTNGIPCELYNYAYYKLINHSGKIASALHRDIYHKVHEIRKKIEDQKITKLAQINEDVENILRIYQFALHDVFRLDLSIGVKLIERDNGQYLLKSYKFFPSNKERKKISHRKVDNVYLLYEDSSKSLKVYTEKAREYAHDDGNAKYKRNSIYDYILSTSNNSWISNNLQIEESNDSFFTSSDNYKEFYNSMAAFAILPPNCLLEKKNRIKGVLTFDSYDTGVFSTHECNMLMGVMAHYLYELLENLK